MAYWMLENNYRIISGKALALKSGNSGEFPKAPNLSAIHGPKPGQQWMPRSRLCWG